LAKIRTQQVEEAFAQGAGVSLSIVTLTPEALALFLMRHRRGETLERFEPRLDHFLRDILTKANEFIPSESGAILLDDPRAKMFSSPGNQLTIIASFGKHAQQLLGQRLTGDHGIIGEVYRTGHSRRSTKEEEARLFYAELEGGSGLHPHSLLTVPVILGNSICGVLLLINRLSGVVYTEEECTLIEIFAGYISSSIQNALDGIRAKELARRDDLTGLFNDRYFHFRLREEIVQADSGGHNLTLIFLDLDHFKQVNDRYGHLEGSRTLHEMGLLLSKESPAEAVIARYGGDEFVIILSRVGATHANEVAKALQVKISTASMIFKRLHDLGEEQGVITASMGIATLHEHVPNQGTIAQRANTLIRMADTAMYRAKSEGRNRVVVAIPRTKEYPIVTSSR
jgi:diguanylate cyclase (GGDEF)-like protein